MVTLEWQGCFKSFVPQLGSFWDLYFKRMDNHLSQVSCFILQAALLYCPDGKKVSYGAATSLEAFSKNTYSLPACRSEFNCS